MATIFTIFAKGNTKVEIDKNLAVIDSYMNQQNFLILVSSINPNFNPRIYYSKNTVEMKYIHNLITELRTDKIINKSIRGIEYSGHLNKI